MYNYDTCRCTHVTMYMCTHIHVIVNTTLVHVCLDIIMFISTCIYNYDVSFSPHFLTTSYVFFS